MITDAEQRKLRVSLQDEQPVSHPSLFTRLISKPCAIDAARAATLIGEAQAANMIRWVAYRGWMWGGRP